MHILDITTTFIALTLVGVEFSVAAFINPAANRLAPEPRLQILSRLALVLGRVMPVWYPVSSLLFAVETWLHWHTESAHTLLAGTVLWLFASLASILFLVPLNTRIANAAPDWQEAHHTWNRRHRVRVAVLAAGAILLLVALMR